MTLENISLADPGVVVPPQRAGGPTPRYVRLRPGASLSALLENEHEASLPGSVKPFLLKTTTEILNFRPTMSYGLVGGEPR